MPSIISFIGQTTSSTTNSFSSIQTPSGTSPTASSPTDTLTLTSTDGTVTITGNSATDTIDFSVPSAPLAATYVTLTANATLPNERLLTAGTGISIVDGGAGSTVTINSSGITALTGDITATGPGSVAATLATVNANVGTFGSSTSIPTFTVNAKGLITAASGNVVIAPAGTLTGTTLNATVVTSSLTSVGTITSGTWTGTTIAVANGGTSLTTLTSNNLIVGAGTSAVTFIAPGTSGNILQSNGTVWASTTLATANIAPADAPYLTIGVATGLTQERSFAVNSTNLTAVDLGPNNAYSINTIQNIDTTATPTFQRLLLSGSTNQNFINASGTLDGATGNEIAYTLAYTTNKATSGNDTGLLISMTDTLSPGTSLPLDIQVGASSKLSVDNAGLLTSVNHTITALSAVGVVLNSAAGVLSTLAPGTSGNVLTSNGSAWVSSASAGGGMSIGGTVTSGTAGSILFVNAGPILAQDNSHLFWDDTNNRLGVNTASPTAAVNITSATGEKLLTVTAPAFSTAASTEFTSLTFDLSATHTFQSGAITTQRAVRIQSPTYAMTGIDTLTTAATLSIEGPPAAGSSINLTNTYGLWIPTRNVTSSAQYGVGAVIAAPTGAFGSNIAMIVDGKFGMGTYTPQSYFDIQPTAFDNTMSHVCTDGPTRYSEGYFGGTQWTSIPASGGATLIIDTGANYPAATSFSQRTFQTLFTLDGANNYTGAIINSNAVTTVRTSAGTTTTVTNNNSTISTSSVANITTSRNYLSTSTYAGSGTVTTAANYDTTNTVSGSTVTDLIGFRFSLPTVSSGTLTTVTAIDLLDQTQTTTTKIGIRQRGTNAHNRFNGNTSFGQDATPGATVDVAGKMFIAGATGTVSKYNNIATVSGGVPSELATVDLATQAAAIADTTIYTPTATGLFRVSIYLQVTRAATTSSILGGATGVVIKFNDGDGNVAQANTAALATTAGAIAVTAAGNTTGTNLEGTMVIYARTGVAITYAIGYTSVGGTTMQFAAHLKVEAM